MNTVSRIKAALVFQVKLALDALRDFALSPVSIVCAIIDIITGKPKGEGLFDKLLSFGRKTDHWINLFDHHDETTDSQNRSAKVDDWISELETVVKNRVKQGQMSKAEQAAVEQFIRTSQPTETRHESPK